MAGGPELEPLGRRQAAPETRLPTTLSTIAVQSGSTRIIIALLQNCEWVELKVLEMTPDLTQLGQNIEQALLLQQQHDEVLQKLASKQSPVEELLNQADQLIANQKPKAEVYSAMAESLGLAWRDLNAQLETRRQLLQHSVDFHSRSRSFSDSMDLAERVFGDVSIPSDVEEARAAIRQQTEVKKTMLESSMATLQEGNQLLGRLRQLVKQGTIDSRPKHLRASVQSACAQVERWLEELHDRRRCLESLFSGRRLVLQQCLSLSQLYADLGAVQKRAELIRRELAGSCRLGESPDSSAILLEQHGRLEQEAKAVQDAALRLLGAAEALVRSATHARDEPRTRAYAVLEVCTQLTEETDRRRSLLSGAHQFFQHAQQTLERLSALELKLGSAALPDKPRLHAETAAALQQVAAAAINAGNALLDQAGGGTDGTEGVSDCVVELQRRVEGLNALCTAHKEETLRQAQLNTHFLEKYNTGE